MSTQPPKQTILHLSTTSGPGGAERVISTLTAALNDNGFRVIVGLFRAGWLQQECECRGVQTVVIPLNGPFHWKWFRGCLQLIRQEKIGIIHGHEFSAIVYGWIVSRLTRTPFVGTVHGKNYFWEKIRRRLAFRAIARTGTLVAVSQDLKRFIIEKVDIPDSRIRLVYNGVQRNPSVCKADVERCRTQLGIKAGDLVIGSVGSLYPVKGHQYLLDAMPMILKQHPKSFLLLIGRGELEMPLKEQAKHLGIEMRVHFLGLRQDVPTLFALMDVFVLPSLSEGLSMALLEAMDAGKPVVATSVGGNSELIDHEQTGLLVQTKDANALAKALTGILSDPSLRQDYGHAGAEKIRLGFSLNRMVARYCDIYRAVVK